MHCAGEPPLLPNRPAHHDRSSQQVDEHQQSSKGKQVRLRHDSYLGCRPGDSRSRGKRRINVGCSNARMSKQCRRCRRHRKGHKPEYSEGNGNQRRHGELQECDQQKGMSQRGRLAVSQPHQDEEQDCNRCRLPKRRTQIRSPQSGQPVDEVGGVHDLPPSAFFFSSSSRFCRSFSSFRLGGRPSKSDATSATLSPAKTRCSTRPSRFA